MRYFIPLLLFLGIMLFLWKGLSHDPHQLSSALLNKPLPAFNAQNLIHANERITEQSFLGHVTLLNIWATWCVTCHLEHPVLMDIAQTHEVMIDGLNYKDDSVAAQKWLTQYGNPYAVVISDKKGDLGINLGVYGTPETFIIDKKGIVRYKYVGAMTWHDWETIMKPQVKRWMQSS